MHFRLFSIIVPLALIILISPAKVAYGLSFTPQLYLKDSSPYGTPYTDWIKKWWQWSVSLPKTNHPETNPNLMCATKDSGQVSFLGLRTRGISHYSCTITTKNAIMVPISTATCTSIEAHSTKPADLINCAVAGAKYLTFKVSLDGIPLTNLDNNYAKTNIFNMTLPSDNFEFLKAGTYPTGGAGYFVFLKPLPAGEHNLHIAARVLNPTDPSFNFDYNNFYNLKIR